jgi:hypothetical protein
MEDGDKGNKEEEEEQGKNDLGAGTEDVIEETPRSVEAASSAEAADAKVAALVVSSISSWSIFHCCQSLLKVLLKACL